MRTWCPKLERSIPQGDDRIERCVAVDFKLMVEFAFFTAFDWFALAMRAPSRWCPQPLCRFIPNPCFCKFCIGLLAEMLDILHFQVIGGDERSKQGWWYTVLDILVAEPMIFYAQSQRQLCGNERWKCKNILATTRFLQTCWSETKFVRFYPIQWRWILYTQSSGDENILPDPVKGEQFYSIQWRW